MTLDFIPDSDPPAVMCPMTESATSVNTCGSCKHRDVIDFDKYAVKCTFSDDLRDCPKFDPPGRVKISSRICEDCKDRVCEADAEPQDNRVVTLSVTGIPPCVTCPKGFGGIRVPVPQCYSCWHMVSVSWTHVKCAFPKKGADFGGTRPSAT